MTTVLLRKGTVYSMGRLDECTKEGNNVTNSKVDTYSITDDPVGSWDEYFFNVCRQVARNSKCFSRRIGAVLVKDRNIVSTGYNGPPRGIPECDKRWTIDDVFNTAYIKMVSGGVVGKCPRKAIGFKSGQGLEVCVAAHAEENSILAAARLGIPTLGSTMYANCGIPCSKCLIKIINAGVKEIVLTNMDLYDITSKYLLDNSDLKVRTYSFIK